jgi:HPr Serine kinase C-terminal domain
MSAPALARSASQVSPTQLVSQSHSYRAYGLSIDSELELSDLVPGPPGQDVRIRYGPVERVRDPGDGSPLWWAADPTCARITFAPVGSFVIRDGREIVLDVSPGADEAIVRQVVLGPAFAVLLTQRGFITLHGSAVAVGDAGVIFLAGQGAGKSTTAGVMLGRGHALIADDAVAVAGPSDAPLLPPGFPRLKLWPEAATSLGVAPDQLSELYADLDKRGWAVPDSFAAEAVPPTHVYVLAVGDKLAIEALRPAEAVIELIRNAHGVMAMKGVVAGDQLRRTAALAEHLTVRRLVRPLALETLFEVAEAVEADVASSATQGGES